MAKKKPEPKSEVIHLAEANGLVYFLTNQYEESDNGDGVGNIHSLKDPRSFDDSPLQVLSSNDTVRVMWASPSGALWTGSADGIVATQAKTRWAKYGGALEYEAMNRSPKWNVVELPPASADGTAPNVTALWGTSDDNVFVGTFTGDIYQGGTAGWKQVYDGNAAGEHTINAFGGSGPDNLFAVGNGAQILHFDGKAWTPIRPPGLPNGTESFSDVHTLPNGEVLILGSGDESRLLYGSARNLTEFGRYATGLIAMAPLGDNRLLFATPGGVAELVGHQVSLINTDYEPISAFAGNGRVFFTDAEQEYPAFIEYDPRHADKPWDRPEY